MFNNSTEDFFNEKLEDDDFPSNFFLHQDQHPPLPQIDTQNHFNLLFENDHFSMDIKNLKSQIINSDLLIENNERLKKKVQELDIENKELKLLNIKARDQEHQRFIALESKLKAAEMMNNQFKEQLSYHSKENNPQILAFREKFKQQEKIIKSKEEEIMRKDEEIRHKIALMEEMRRTLTGYEAEIKALQEKKPEISKKIEKNGGLEVFRFKKNIFLVKKRLKKLKNRLLKSEKGLKESFITKVQENEDLKHEIKGFRSEFSKNKEIQEEIFSQKISLFKQEFLQELPNRLLSLLEAPELKTKFTELFTTKLEPDTKYTKEPFLVKQEKLEKPQEKIKKIKEKFEKTPEIFEKPLEKPLEKFEKTQEKIENLSETLSKKPETFEKSEFSLENSSPMPSSPLPSQKHENLNLKSQSSQSIKKPKKTSTKPSKESNTKNPLKTTIKDFDLSQETSFDSDAKIRKVQKKLSISFTKPPLNEPIEKPTDSKEVIKSFLAFYYKKPFLQARETGTDSFKMHLFMILSQLPSGFSAKDLLETLQETSNNSESFETSLALSEFLNDLSIIPEEQQLLNLLEDLKESLKTPYPVSWKWAMKTRNPRYFSVEKKEVFIAFLQKIFSSSLFQPFDHLFEKLQASPDNESLVRSLQSLCPISANLNNDLLDLLTVNLIKGYQLKSQNLRISRFLYEFLTQKFVIPRTEILINQLYCFILLTPKSFQPTESDLLRGYDLDWLLNIAIAQSWSPPYGPLTLQAIRLCIVDVCNHWKLVNRNSQNPFLQIEFDRKTLFILIRLHELLDSAKNDVLFGLFNYESLKKSFIEGLYEGKKSNKEDWPWFRGLSIDPMFMSSLLTNNLINILDKSLFYWEGLLINNTINLKGALDLYDIMATMGVYMGYQPFYMTGILQKNLFGFVYNKKYDLTFQRTLSLLALTMMSRSGDKEMMEILLAIIQERIPNIRIGQMDKVAALWGLWKKFGANVKEVIEQNMSFLNPFVLEVMNFLALYNNRNS